MKTSRKNSQLFSEYSVSQIVENVNNKYDGFTKKREIDSVLMSDENMPNVI